MDYAMIKFGFGEEVVNKLKIKSILGHVLLSPEGFHRSCYDSMFYSEVVI